MAVIWVQPSTRKKGAWTVGKVGFPVETRKSKRGAISWAKGWAQPGDEIKIVEKNPSGSKGKFARCVADVKARGSAYDPRAVCAASERKAYGQKELTRRAIAGKRRAARGNPPRVTQRDVDAAAASYHNRLMQYGDNNMATQRAEFAYRELQRRHAEQKEKRKSRGNAAPGSTIDRLEKELRGARQDLILSLTPRASKAARKKIEAIEKKLEEARSHSRGNPAEPSAAAYEKFHGEPPTTYTTVTERIHYHGNLWSLGDLTLLKIRTVTGTAIVALSGFRGTFLAANEQAFADLSRTGKARAQLFIKGGDQSIHLEDFGIDPDRSHEVETLGQATLVDYETNKVHLGAEGGKAVYEHKFRRTREGDAEIKVKWARYPDVIYRVLDQRLEFSGGSYELIAEGINL